MEFHYRSHKIRPKAMPLFHRLKMCQTGEICGLMLGACQTYVLTARFLPPPEEASLLLAASGPPSFASAALHGGFSSLSLKRSLREASLRLAHQKQASCLLLVCRLRSLPPPSMAAFLRYCLSALFGRRVYDSPSRSKPPACCFRAAFVRFRRHPWRLFLTIA